MKHDKYFKTLGLIARDLPRVFRAQISAGIVFKNYFVSFGSNQLKTHPIQQKFSKHDDAIYLHAETDAIKNALNYGRPKDKPVQLNVPATQEEIFMRLQENP